MNRRHILYSMLYDMQKQTHEAFLSPDGNAVAVVSPGKPLWLYPGENSGDEAARLFFVSVIQKLTAKPVGIIAPQNAARICAETCCAVYGGSLSEKEIIAYYLENNSKIKSAPKAPGILREASVKNSAFIAGWLEAFYGESFNRTLSLDEKPPTEKPAVKIENKLFIWQDGCPVAMGMLCGGSAAARLNLIYTAPEFRRRGYGAAVVKALARMAAEAGKIPMLYTTADNAAANALYRSLGFTEAGRLTELTIGR